MENPTPLGLSLYTTSMPTDTSPEEKPKALIALATLAEVHARGVRLATDPDLVFGRVGMWLGAIRREVGKL